MTNVTVQPEQPTIWWIFLLQGIAAILLGVMLLTAPGTTLLTLVTFLGFYWIVSGVLSFVQMFVDCHWHPHNFPLVCRAEPETSARTPPRTLVLLR